MRDRQLKRRLRLGSVPDYLQTAAQALWRSPVIAANYLRLGRPPQAWHGAPAARRAFCGIAVDPKDADAAQQADLIAELGVQQVLVRIPAWQPERLAALRAFAAAVQAGSLTLVIMQHRRHVCEPDTWRQALRSIATQFAGLSQDLVIGQATNRLKWGCAHEGEYLRLAAIAQEELRPHFPRLRLFGSQVLDFEPLATLRSLDARGGPWDGAAAGLYVDRRGGPRNRQWAFFDARRKLRLIAAILASQPCVRHRLWISEVNWPLADQGQHAPADARYAVDEETAGRYLIDYLDDIHASGLAERCFIWQLVARGYGLVDPSGDRLRRRPAFTLLRQWLQAAPIPADQNPA